MRGTTYPSCEGAVRVRNEGVGEAVVVRGRASLHSTASSLQPHALTNSPGAILTMRAYKAVAAIAETFVFVYLGT